MNDESLPGITEPGAETDIRVDGILSFSPTPLQQRVIDIAIALMEDHYTLDTERLHKACTRTIKEYDVTAIDAALSDLYYKRVLIGGKAITKLSLLDNQNRCEIYNLVKRSPGINAARIQQTLGLSFGTVAWHLKMLAKFKLVRTEYIKESLTCFDFSIDKRLDVVFVILQKKQMAEILSIFLHVGSVRQVDLFTQLSMARTTLLRKLKELEVAGIITRDQKGGDDPTMLIAPEHAAIVEQAVRR